MRPLNQEPVGIDPEDEVGQVRAMFRAMLAGLLLALVSAGFTVYFFSKWMSWI